MSFALLRTASAVASLAAVFASVAPAQVVTRVDVDSSGNQATNGSSFTPALSTGGRFVAFISSADNLVAGVSGLHVYVHDMQTGSNEVVDVDSSGTLGDRAPETDAIAISADGRFVAFSSSADNLVAGDTNLNPDVFVHDRSTGVTECVSVDSSGTQSNGFSSMPSISADGSQVAFLSDATNLVSGAGGKQAYVHDRSTGVTEIESVDTSGNPSPSPILSCAISGDGNSVALVTNATLAAGDTNVWDYDAMVRDRKVGVTTLATLDSNGVQRDCTAASSVSLSNDGRFVAFVSVQKLDVNLQVSGHEMVFLRDMKNLTTVCVSVSDSGEVADDACFGGVVSADGGLVAFGSWARNLSSDPGTGLGNVFRRDLAKGVTDWCSENVHGKAADGDSGIYDDEGHCWIAISPNDGRVAYWSYANDLVAGDTNKLGDVFAFGQPLTLIADPESAPAGATMTFSSFVGEAGGTLMLVATNVDGIPMFTQVAFGLFDSSGLFTLSGIVPFGLNGHVVTLETVGVLPSGKLGISNHEVVTFQ